MMTFRSERFDKLLSLLQVRVLPYYHLIVTFTVITVAIIG